MKTVMAAISLSLFVFALPLREASAVVPGESRPSATKKVQSRSGLTRSVLTKFVLTKSVLTTPAKSSAKSSTKSSLLTAPTAKIPTDDVVARALKDELKRSMNHLRLDQYQGPYFGSYTIEQNDSFTVTASFGAVDASRRSRSRSLHVVMREGNYVLDSSNSGGGGIFSGLLGGLSSHVGSPITCDDDYDAIRHEVWLKTDEAYKKAIEDLASKKAYLLENNVKELPDSMSREQPVVMVQAVNQLNCDQAKLTAMTRKLSSVFRNYPKIQKSYVRFGEEAQTRWFINNEGFYFRVPRLACKLTVGASSQAADGTMISDALSIPAGSSSELPSYNELEKRVENLAQRISTLCEAKEIEEYRGPILFEGEAAAAFFSDILQPNLGHSAEALSKYGGHKNPLADRIGQRILPPFITVVDDPLTTHFGKTKILSAYVLDDDGVKGQKITLVDKGILKTFAMSRVPAKEIKHSNGHALGHNGSARNLYILSDTKMTSAQLKQRLLVLGKEEGLKSVLLVRRLATTVGSLLSPGSLISSMLGIFGKGGEVRLSAPLELVRVNVDTGHEEIVRGGEFGNLTLRILRDIDATADDIKPYTVEAGVGGGLQTMGYDSSTIVTPSILVKEVELQKPSKQTDLLPLLKNPYFENQK